MKYYSIRNPKNVLRIYFLITTINVKFISPELKIFHTIIIETNKLHFFLKIKKPGQ